MALINWAFLCDYAYADGVEKAYIMGTFENISLSSLPAIFPRLFVVFEVKMAADESCDFAVVVTSPSGIELAGDKALGIAPADVGKSIQTFGFYNMEFSETGEHRATIFIDGISYHFIPFTVWIE
jgi:hypothetical protein